MVFRFPPRHLRLPISDEHSDSLIPPQRDSSSWSHWWSVLQVVLFRFHPGVSTASKSRAVLRTGNDPPSKNFRFADVGPGRNRSKFRLPIWSSRPRRLDVREWVVSWWSPPGFVVPALSFPIVKGVGRMSVNGFRFRCQANESPTSLGGRNSCDHCHPFLHRCIL